MNLDKLADEFESLSIEDKINILFIIFDSELNPIKLCKERQFYKDIITKNPLNKIIINCCKTANENIDISLVKQEALRLVKLEIAKNREKKIDEILND